MAQQQPAALDPATALEQTAWALAALIATQTEAARTPLSDVLNSAPERTAVLEAAGLLQRDGDDLVPHPALVAFSGPQAENSAAAKLSSLRQAVAAAAGEAGVADGWSGHSDEVVLNQGRASAGTGAALATRIVPELAGLTDRLAVPGSRILDVGTGVGALAVALARNLPQVEVTGIDVLEHVLDLARREIAAASDVASRVSVRLQDVADLDERGTYELVWLPAPFLSETSLTKALPRVVDALVPGGWLVIGTNATSADPLQIAVSRWTALRNGGNTFDTDRMAATLTSAGLSDVQRFPTVPGGPILVAARHQGS
ncbi:cyclopropane-fatty-acyl-phospholipid synthase family protein [Amycolatopsis sp. GM8]|uniref:SAM-dependent methyltransferase n=1 Tax=Amycolatopsis sp. GM8 TaxID=2896530 RepID=UPI001F1937FB|nr:class I SAM-dependent methyltransferase [Amycolatopsis sp. GM8]